jgi:copper homeostasis protein
MIFEVCVDSVEGAIAAQEGGAQRVELCADLVEGGITPSLGIIRLTCMNVVVDVNVIIRPRGGDFCYSPLEYEAMRQDIRAVRESSADGVVIGLLLPDGSIDVERTRGLVELARPLKVTFHRAFDMCRNRAEALETLIELGIDNILTSGGEADAMQGADEIASLMRQAAGRVGLIAGAGINAENVQEIIRRTGVNQIHFSARQQVESPMSFRNLKCCMGKAYQPNEYMVKNTSSDLVRAVIETGIKC